ncbi:MAG: arsenite methyltransferase, partial [Planctomycetota bacterium]
MSHEIQKIVQSKYASIAESPLSNDHEGVRAVANAFGYTLEELTSIPAESNMGLSCGNPTAQANIRPGETVVDLGCGGGLDVFLASPKVGPKGKVIGIDMTSEMIERGRKNAKKGPNGKPYSNVEFYLAEIENLPLRNSSVDCVISNCVINLVSDKQKAFQEIARILKPGGRLAISDIALKKILPLEISKNLMAYVGCIAGAILIDDYKKILIQSGFSAVEIVDTHSDLNAYKKIENQSCCGSTENASLIQPETASCCGGTPSPSEN